MELTDMDAASNEGDFALAPGTDGRVSGSLTHSPEAWYLSRL